MSGPKWWEIDSVDDDSGDVTTAHGHGEADEVADAATHLEEAKEGSGSTVTLVELDEEEPDW